MGNIWYISPTGTGDGKTPSTPLRYSDISSADIKNYHQLIFEPGTYTESATIPAWVYIRPQVEGDRTIIFDCPTGTSMTISKGVSFERCPNFVFNVNDTHPAIKFDIERYDLQLAQSNLINILFKKTTTGSGIGIGIYYNVRDNLSSRVATTDILGSPYSIDQMKFILNVNFCTFYHMKYGIYVVVDNTSTTYSVEVTTNISGNIFDTVETYLKKIPEISTALSKKTGGFSTISSLTSYNNFDDPQFYDPPTDFKLSMISQCINGFPDGSDLGCYGGITGYEWPEAYDSNFEVKLLNHKKSSPDGYDHPGTNYKATGTKQVNGDKACGPFVIGLTEADTDYDRFTPAFTSIANGILCATLDNINWVDFLSDGGTLTPEYGFMKADYLGWDAVTSDIVDETQPSGAASGNWYGWKDFNGTSSTATGRVELTSETIDTLDGSTPFIPGIYIVYVRIKYSVGLIEGYLRSFCLFKYSDQSPVATVSRGILDDKTDVYPGENIKFRLDYTCDIPADRVFYGKEYYDGSSWISDISLKRVVPKGEEGPIDIDVSFPWENMKCRTWWKARAINGLMSSIIYSKYTDGIYTKLLDPPTPKVEIDSSFDPDGNNGIFIMSDSKNYSDFNYTGAGLDSNTKLTFTLYNGTDELGWNVIATTDLTPIVDYTGRGRSLNEDNTHITWRYAPINLAYLNVGMYKWGIKYTNLNSKVTNEKFATFERQDSRTLEWKTDTSLSPKNILHIGSKWSDRKRVSVNIGEVDVYSTSYATDSTFISTEHVFPKEIYKVMLSVSEQTRDYLTDEVVGSIDYYLSFDRGRTWNQINPMERNKVPELSDILTINSGLTEEQKRLSGRTVTSYVDVSGTTRSVILKAVFKGIQTNKKVTPRLFSYGIKMISRDVLRRQP